MAAEKTLNLQSINISYFRLSKKKKRFSEAINQGTHDIHQNTFLYMCKIPKNSKVMGDVC